MKKALLFFCAMMFATLFAMAQSSVVFPGSTLSGNFNGWGGTGHFYSPTFNVDATGGIEITYYDIDLSQLRFGNTSELKGYAEPGVSAANSMPNIDPLPNSVWGIFHNQDVASGTDWDGNPISTLGPDLTTNTSDDTRHGAIQDWYRSATGGKTNGPGSDIAHNTESYITPNPRFPSATPMSTSDLNSYDFRLRILPTGSGTYTYEMWTRMHNAASNYEGCGYCATCGLYNHAISNCGDANAWRAFENGGNSVFALSDFDLSAVYVFMGLANGNTASAQSLTWGKIEVTGTPTTTPTVVWVDNSYYAGGSNDGHVWGYDAFAAIQDGIDAVDAAGTVNVAAGTYNENLVINKHLIINGTGNGSDPLTNTVIDGNGSVAVSITASGTDVSNRLTLQDLYITGGTRGINIANSASFLKLDHVSANLNSTYGINFDGSFNNEVLITYCTFNQNGIPGSSGVGLRLQSTSKVHNLDIDHSEFNSNYQGFYSGDGGAFYQTNIQLDQINISTSTFDGNTIKGIYIESMSNASLDDITLSNNGSISTYNFGAGIDINLKYNSYSNITIQNSTVTNCGVGSLNGVGITVKARDDGGYASPPATLNNVIIDNVTFSSNKTGLTFGEPGKDNAGPTGIIIENCSFSTNTASDINNNSLSNIDALLNNTFTGASDNYAIEDRIYHKLDNNVKGLVTWVTDNVYVTTNSGSIQRGIDAIDAGGTVNVNVGTYTITSVNIIDKSLTLIGDPGDDSAGPGTNAPVVDGANANIDMFKITNGTSNVTIKGLILQNLRSPGYNTTGTGIQAWVGSTSYITVQDNSFLNLGYNGILVGNDYNSDPSKWGDHTYWTVRKNVFSNCGYISVELTNTSTSTIEDNNIHLNNPYIGAIFSSARRNESDLTIKNNTIDGTTASLYSLIYLYAYDLDMVSPNLNDVNIENNSVTVTGTTTHVYLRDIGTGTITNASVNNNNISSLKTTTVAVIDATDNYWGSTNGPVNEKNVYNMAGQAGFVSAVGTGSIPTFCPWWSDISGAPGTYTGTSFAPITNDDSPVENYINFTDAIAGTSEGGNISAVAGTYTENSIVDKSLTIIGAGIATTHINPTASANAAFTIAADNVTIKDLEITHPTILTFGISVNSPATTGLTLQNVDITNIGGATGPANGHGIYLYTSFSNLNVEDCFFSSGYQGTYSRGIGIFAPNNLTLSNFDVSGSTFENFFVCIYFRSAIDGLNVTTSTFGPFELVDCTAAVSGIYIGDGTDDNFDIKNVTVTENTFTSYGRGVYVWNYGANSTIENFVIDDNTFTNSIWSSAIRFIIGLNGMEDYSFDGIEITNNEFTQDSDIGGNVALIDLRTYDATLLSCDVSVADNNIVFSGGPYTKAMYGIQFFVGGDGFYNTSINGNSLDGGNTVGSGDPVSSGIDVRHYAGDYTWTHNLDLNILNNEISGFDNGVSIYDDVNSVYGGLPTGCDININNNDLSGNNVYGVESGSGETVDATCNYWGTLVATEVAAEIIGNVAYEPWSNADFNCGYVEFSNVYNATQGYYFETIEDAILAANLLDVIEVTGTHNVKDIVVNKGLIIAAGAGGAHFSGLTGSRSGTGLSFNTTDPVSLNGVTFSDYDLALEFIAFGSATITDCRFINNTQAIDNLTTTDIDAENNWWGEPSGPMDDSPIGLYNPLGQGGEVSDYVDYQPWYNDEALTQLPVDIAVYNPACATLEVRIKSAGAVSEVVTNVQFAVAWDVNDYAGDVVVLGSPMYGIFLVNHETDATTGTRYAIFAADFNALTLSLSPNTEQTILTLGLDESGAKFDVADFVIAQDAYAGDMLNNANYYVQLLSSDRTGYIYDFGKDVYVASCDLELDAKVFLQGPYDPSSNVMKTDIASLGFPDFPDEQPYGGEPFNYNPPVNESISSIPADVVDWVLVGLRANPGGPDDFRVAGLLYKDGVIRGVDGELISIEDPALLPNTSYYAVVYHRNHMPVMSASPVNIPNTASFNFTDSWNKGYNALDSEHPMVTLETDVYGMIAGDHYGASWNGSGWDTYDYPDGWLYYTGAQNERDPILAKITNYPGNGPYINGVINDEYFKEDLTMNRQVRYSGSGNDPRLIIQNLIELKNSTNLNSFYESKVPGWAEVHVKKSGQYSSTGPLDIALYDSPRELLVKITANEPFENGLVSNIQFTLCWDAGFYGMEYMINSLQSEFMLEPQGEPVKVNGKMYQVFATVEPVALPDPFNSGEQVTLMKLTKSDPNQVLGDAISIANNAWTMSNNGVYYISVWGVNKTGKILTNALGTDELTGNSASVTVYPNPTSTGWVYITMKPVVSEKLTITLTDVSGRNIYSGTWPVTAGVSTAKTIDLEGLGKGVYMISIKGSSEIKTDKIIIN